MWTWIWDEIECRIVQTAASTCAIGEDDANGWTRQPDDGPVRVYFSDRGHVGLEVEADTKEDAHRLFLSVRPYREMQNDE